MNRPVSDIHAGDPTMTADRLGSAYAARISDEHRKAYGLYLTPPEVARFMGRLVSPGRGSVRLLDPAAGAGILLCATVEAITAAPHHASNVDITAYELDPCIAAELEIVLGDLVKWAARRGVAVSYEIRVEDYVLANAAALAGPANLFSGCLGHPYDVVISNPPYFKLNKADPRSQAASAVVHGQPNIYGLFMAIGAAMLRPGGDFIFITPRSFASGPYFRTFRQRFFGTIRPKLMHVFGSRRDAFSRDAVLQENVILHAVRDDGWRDGSVTVSTSAGLGDLDAPETRVSAIGELLDLTSRDMVLRMPATAGDDTLMRVVDGWTGSLATHGWKISTGPVVAFRAVDFQRLEASPETVPLLWLNHVHPMEVKWPLARRKAEHILDSMASRSILVPNANYVLMRRFTAKEEKRRLVAAPYLARSLNRPVLGLENHLNYIYRPDGSLTEDEALGISAFLNSTLLDTWFRATNGSTQVGATEIRSMPFPPHAIIVALGRKVNGMTDLVRIDALVNDEVRLRADN